MEKQNVINSIYLIPAIIARLEGDSSEYLTLILKDYGIDVEEYRPIINLLKYNMSIIKSDFKPDYELLRTGLTEHHEKFLGGFWDNLQLPRDKVKLLDYCGGEGAYCKSFEEYNSNAEVTLMDRNHGLSVDFESNPGWFMEYNGEFDIVLLSEILHCKGEMDRGYLVASSREVLKVGGLLLINENYDPCMWWRLDMLTEGGKMIQSEDLNFVLELGFKLVGIKQLENYKTYIYERI